MTETSKTLLNLGLTALVSAGTGLVVSELSKDGADRSASVGGNNIDSEALKAQIKESLYNDWLNDPIVQSRLRGPKGENGDIGETPSLGTTTFQNGEVIVGKRADSTYSLLNLLGVSKNYRVINDGDAFRIQISDNPNTNFSTLFEMSSTGTIYKIGGGSFSALSDERVKDNVEDFTNGLAKVLAIQTKSFKYKKVAGTQTEFYPDFICEKTQYGVIAQQLREVCPEMVTEGEDGFLSVDLSNLNLMLVNAVKELDKKDKAQQTTINQYKTRIEALENSLAGVLTRLEALEAPQA